MGSECAEAEKQVDSYYFLTTSLLPLYLVLPKYFVLFERGVLRVVSFGDRYYYSFSYPICSQVQL